MSSSVVICSVPSWPRVRSAVGGGHPYLVKARSNLFAGFCHGHSSAAHVDNDSVLFHTWSLFKSNIQKVYVIRYGTFENKTLILSWSLRTDRLAMF